MVEDQSVAISRCMFADVNLTFSREFGRLVDVNNSALHYPLDIFDRGTVEKDPLNPS